MARAHERKYQRAHGTYTLTFLRLCRGCVRYDLIRKRVFNMPGLTFLSLCKR